MDFYSYNEHDPFEPGQANSPSPQSGKTSTQTDPDLVKAAEAIRARQEAFTRLAESFYELWKGLPEMNVRQVDAWIGFTYHQLLDLAPSLGVSRNGLPQLRECCGKKRVWPAGLGDPGVSSASLPVLRDPVENLKWYPGDIIRRITRLFGAKYCEKCDRRRKAINRFFGRDDE